MVNVTAIVNGGKRYVPLYTHRSQIDLPPQNGLFLYGADANSVSFTASSEATQDVILSKGTFSFGTSTSFFGTCFKEGAIKINDCYYTHEDILKKVRKPIDLDYVGNMEFVSKDNIFKGTAVCDTLNKHAVRMRLAPMVDKAFIEKYADVVNACGTISAFKNYVGSGLPSKEFFTDKAIDHSAVDGCRDFYLACQSILSPMLDAKLNEKEAMIEFYKGSETFKDIDKYAAEKLGQIFNHKPSPKENVNVDSEKVEEPNKDNSKVTNEEKK